MSTRTLSAVAALTLLAGCPMTEPRSGSRPPVVAPSSPVAVAAPGPGVPTALPATGDACSQPNPARMGIDANLTESVETLAGGDFEQEGILPLVAGGPGSRAAVAHSGKWGWTVPSAGSVSVSFSPEKAVTVRFSAWVRSAGAPIQARLSMAGAQPAGGGPPEGAGRPGGPGGPGGRPPGGRPGMAPMMRRGRDIAMR